MSERKKKANLYMIIALINIVIAILAIASGCYISSGGVLAIHGEKELTADILNQSNPFTIEENVKECTFLTGKVVGFNTDTKSVKISILNQPNNVYIYAYLPVNQLKTLSIDQEIKIRGRFNYECYAESSNSTTYIHVGNATSYFIFYVQAAIIK